MKKRYLICLLFLLPLMADAQTNWVEVGDLGQFNFREKIWHSCVDNEDNLYVGSFFNEISKWNGSYWEKISSRDGFDDVYSIRGICSDNSNNIYAAATLSEGFNKYKSIIYFYDGIKWSVLGDSSQYDSILTLNTITSNNSNTIYVSGQYKDSTEHNTLFKIQNNTLLPIASAKGYIENMCITDGGNLYMVIKEDSFSNVYKLDNNNQLIKQGSINAKVAIKTIESDRSGNIYVAGDLRDASNAHIVLKWDGNEWSSLGNINFTSINQILALYCDSENNLYAGGTFWNQNQEGFILKWDGRKWSSLGVIKPNYYSHTHTIIGDKKGNIHACGDYPREDYQYIVKYSENSSHIQELISKNKSKISPNPSDGKFHIDGLDDKTQVIIYDVKGESIPFDRFNNTFSLKNCISGIYIVKLYSKNHTLINSEKLIIK